jgi:hypothetical protein
LFFLLHICTSQFSRGTISDTYLRLQKKEELGKYGAKKANKTSPGVSGNCSGL